ncbi:MAG: PIN domain-containing protein [Oculatellaceae cyanobacterium Prado106]|nr:PIN domain-containing protein [Oculatellaceae cyanobacterium Prado106]
MQTKSRLTYYTQNIRVVSVDTELLTQALKLYQKYSDKSWGLTDCISFVVMQTHQITDAVTTDRHFTQAGFRILMLATNSRSTKKPLTE